MSKRWLIRRLLGALLAIFAILIINFLIPRIASSPTVIYSSGTRMTEAERQVIISRFGLDSSLWNQFWRYIFNFFRGDFGASFKYFPSSVVSLIWRALPFSLFAVFGALILQVILVFFFGMRSTREIGGNLDSAKQATILAISASPKFWLAMLGAYALFRLGWVPMEVQHGSTSWLNLLPDLVLIIPLLAVTQFGVHQLAMRSNTINIIQDISNDSSEEYGIHTNEYKHSVINRMLPIFKTLGIRYSLMIGALVVMEIVLGYRGIGYLMFESVASRDFPLLHGCFIILAVSIIVVGLLADILYHWLSRKISTIGASVGPTIKV